MSELTPEERRAVEAAVTGWADHDDRIAPEIEDRVRREGYGDEAACTAMAYGMGHLSGFRAGVEAAAEVARKAHERSARHENTAGCQAAATIVTEIRALAQAQENEHGS